MKEMNQVFFSVPVKKQKTKLFIHVMLFFMCVYIYLTTCTLECVQNRCFLLIDECCFAVTHLGHNINIPEHIKLYKTRPNHITTPKRYAKKNRDVVDDDDDCVDEEQGESDSQQKKR